MQECTHGLLEHGGTEAGGESRIAGRTAMLGVGRGQGGAVTADDEAVKLLDGPAQQLEAHDQTDDADAGAGKHAVRGDVPGRGDEAGVNRVPVPKHLREPAV